MIPGAHGFCGNAPFNTPKEPRVGPKVVPNQQQQAGNAVRNPGNGGKPYKGGNSPEYDACPAESSSTEQKQPMEHKQYNQEKKEKSDTNTNQGKKRKVSSNIDADRRLVKLAEKACKNQDIQATLNRMADSLANANLCPGMEGVYLGNNVREYRARNGARLYTREVGDQVVIIAKSSKNRLNQESVIQ